MVNRLYLVFTAESLINGPLSVYNMDDLKISNNMYKIMKDINKYDVKLNREEFRMIGITIEEMLIKRRQLSQEVVGSILKELSYIINKEVPKMYLL